MTAASVADTRSEFDRQREHAVERIVIPPDGSFSQDYMLDERLELLAEILIEHCDELKFIGKLDFKVIYLWKRAGGASSGRSILGKCIKLSGLVKYFGEADYVIWLAADHCHQIHSDFLTKRRGQDLNFAALMYHELRHVDKDDKDQPATQGHEFEGFANEIERFGIWREDMKPIAAAFQQSLFPEEAVTQ